jgi:hypothetical protein
MASIIIRASFQAVLGVKLKSDWCIAQPIGLNLAPAIPQENAIISGRPLVGLQ